MSEHFWKLDPFRGLFKSGFPILHYHKIGRAPLLDRRKGLFVSKRFLAAQLAELKEGGFEFITLKPAYSPGAIVITFDDGYASVFEQGMSVLESVGCKATQFLISGRIGKVNDWDRTGERLMDVRQVRDWLAAGHSIGSHTVSHPDLTRLSVRESREEISASRKSLEDKFGVAVTCFAYPGGTYDERIVELVKETGYSAAVTTEFGVNTAETDIHKLRRISAYRSLRESLGCIAYLR